MGGIPIIVIVVFLVIWVLTNVLRAQQDDAKTARRPPAGQPNRPAAPLERNSTSDIDRFLAEIDRLRQRGGQQAQEAPTAQRSPPPAAQVARPRPQPQPKPRPEQAQRPRPTATPRPAPPATPQRPAPPPQVAARAAPEPPIVATVIPAPVPAAPEVRYTESGLQTTLAPLPVGAQSPTLRKPPAKGSVMAAVETMMRGKQSLVAAIIVGEILGKPKSQRR
jgi:hypothetical protein